MERIDESLRIRDNYFMSSFQESQVCTTQIGEEMSQMPTMSQHHVAGVPSCCGL